MADDSSASVELRDVAVYYGKIDPEAFIAALVQLTELAAPHDR